jgi:hypothetical protein
MDNLYFNQEQPKKQEPKLEDQPVPVAPPADSKEVFIIRTKETGDKVYRIKGGVAYWVMNPQVLEAINGSFDDVITVPYEFLISLEKGTPLSMQNYTEFIIEKNEG